MSSPTSRSPTVRRPNPPESPPSGPEASRAPIDPLEREIQDLYTADEAPWIIGYSGGKVSKVTTNAIFTTHVIRKALGLALKGDEAKVEKDPMRREAA